MLLRTFPLSSVLSNLIMCPGAVCFVHVLGIYYICKIVVSTESEKENCHFFRLEIFISVFNFCGFFHYVFKFTNVFFLQCLIQSLSSVWHFATPWSAAYQASLSVTNSQSSLKLMSIESVMPSNHFILYCSLLLLPAIFPSISLFQWVSSSHQVATALEFQLQHQSFQWIFRTDFLQDELVESPWRPGDSQESSPIPQFKSINSSALSFLYSPTLTNIHDYQKNHTFG